MYWKRLFFEPIKIFQSSAKQKNKIKTKNKTYVEFCWTEKYLKIEEYVNIYNRSYSWGIIFQNAQKYT